MVTTRIPRTVRTLTAALALAAALPAAAAPGAPRRPAGGPAAELAELRRLHARYAPVDLAVDLSRLPASEREALAHLVRAGRIMDGLFLEQAWGGNAALLVELAADGSPLGRERLAYFLRNKGPWDRLDHDRAFLPGVPAKPEGAAFYPPGATREAIEAWTKGLSPEARADAQGFFTLVRALPDGRFAAVPYSIAYQAGLGEAARHLDAAAAATADQGLRAFLRARAAAFRTNRYRESDVAWMRTDSAVEATIGPYEVYEDALFNAKAAFEAFVGVRDEAETARLSRFSAELQGIEDALPLDARFKNPRVGGLAPIRVVNQLYAGGDAARGVTTAAFNLPNDEVVVQSMGSKRVMLKNVQEAKFARVLLPIARVALAPADRAKVSFDAFFTHILVHELVHGLGPHGIEADGERTTVRARLGDAYAAIEEAKADVVGLFALEKLLDEGKVDARLREALYPTFVASAFRSIRFGLSEAHGKGMALQLAWLLDGEAIRARPDGTVAIDPARMRAAIAGLARELLELQAHGDRARALRLLERATLRPEVARVLDRLGGVPVDIAPSFVTAAAIAP
jgi:hypothetical protein